MSLAWKQSNSNAVQLENKFSGIGTSPGLAGTQSHCGQYMRWIERTGGAGGTAGGANPQFIEQHQDGFGFHTLKTEVGCVRKPHIRRANSEYTGNLAQQR